MKGKKAISGKLKDLIIKCLTYEIQEKELMVLNDWLNEDLENRSLFNNFRKVWIASGTLTQQRNPETDKNFNDLRNKISNKKELKSMYIKPFRNYVKYIAVAASYLIFLFIGSLLPLNKRSYNEMSSKSGNIKTEIQAPLGAKCRVILPDNTEVWLNAGSTIIYDKSFNFKERLIQLQGEAYFAVVANKDCPFRVKTTDLLITALGTKFNIKAYPEEETITATLEEGKIDIKLINGKKSAEQIILNPNENIVFYKIDSRLKLDSSNNFKPELKKIEYKTQAIHKIKIESDIKTELYTSWKENRWIFLGEPLPSLASKLERRFNMRIVFTEDLLRDYKFSGTIENETIEQILQALRLTAPLKYRIEKDTIILSVDDQLLGKYKRIIRSKN